MRILVTGNLGYVGPVLGKEIKKYIANCFLSGLDSGIFATCLNGLHKRLGDTYYDKQYFLDIRDLNDEIIKNFEYVICLSAISNDPIGNDFEEATFSINLDSTIRLAKLCDKNGIKKFIFASSCSIYGEASNFSRKESDQTNPLTAYSKSKVNAENKLKNLFNKSSMEIYCLRFATACGPSDRLRLDLVLNDFVASALKYGCITILSDGSPLRPLIDVRDMAKAIIWALLFKDLNKNIEYPKNIISINIGSNDWNFMISDLAQKVKDQLPKTEIKLNKLATPDKRSYKVNFDLFKRLGGEFYTNRKIEDTINDLINQLNNIDLPDQGFRKTEFIRLNHLKNLIKNKFIDKKLRWII